MLIWLIICEETHGDKLTNMVNNLKAQLALEDNNYLIKTNSEGLDLKVGSEEHGGGDMYHYTIDSMIRLGNAYGDTIIEEGLLK